MCRGAEAGNIVFNLDFKLSPGMNIGFRVFARCARLIFRRRFGSRCWSRLYWSWVTVKMGPTAASETSPANLPRTSCKNPKTKNQYRFCKCPLFGVIVCVCWRFWCCSQCYRVRCSAFPVSFSLPCKNVSHYGYCNSELFRCPRIFIFSKPASWLWCSVMHKLLLTYRNEVN